MFSEYMIICIFYILGIIISKNFDMPGAIFLSALMLFTIITRSIVKKRIRWDFLLLCLLLLFGSFRYFQQTQSILCSEFSEKYVTVSGTIHSQPSPSESEYKNRYVLNLDHISYLGKTVDTDEKILLHTKESFPFGTKVTAYGFLNEIDGIQNEHEFDFSLYYAGKGIFGRLVAQEITATGEDFSLSPDFLSGKARYRAASIIDRHFDGDSAAFLKAIVADDKGGFSDDYLTLLIETGIYRILYTPFIHISLIFFLAGLLPLDQKNRSYIIVAMIFLYGITNSSSPTIIKAAILSGLFLLRSQRCGFANKADLIAKTLLIITVFDPLLCFNPGFLMSVASSFIIYVSYKPIYLRILRYFSVRKIKGRQFFSKILTLWIIFAIGTLPLSAYFFSGVSIYAVIFTVLATPLMMFVLTVSPLMLLSLGIFGVSPVLAPIINAIMELISFLPQLVRQLPAYHVMLRVPKTSEIIVFYLLWWALLRIMDYKLKTKTTAVILTVAAGIFLTTIPVYNPNTLSIYFVNVGQGDGAVLHTSHGETVLIDGGGAAEYETDYSVGKRVFVPYLISHGFSDIDVAIVSHCHKDHIEGIIAASEILRIDTLVMPKIDINDPYGLQLLKVAENKGITVEFLSAGDKILFKSGLCISFIAPDIEQTKSDEPNDTSLVAHVTYGKFSALFTGDSTDEISNDYPKNVDILKVAHHGSDNHTSWEYLKHVNPEYAVISVGEGNSYNLPSPNVITRLKDNDAKILRTDKMGDIQFTVRKDGTVLYKTLKGE